MARDADVIVVGSGPGGAQAAETLVEAGAGVVLLDAGTTPDDVVLPPPRSFADLRHDDVGQHRYFIGDDFAGIPLARLGAAPQVTSPRRHVIRTVDGFAPVIAAEQFAALESHALGGLGSAWGAVSFPFTARELARAGFESAPMRPHYERVARRVGISGCADDDLAPLRGPLEALQPTLPPDHNAAALLAGYARKRARLQRRGLFVGRPLLAALSQALPGRDAHALLDMDFWGDAGRSVYRPAWTIAKLMTRANFTFRPGWVVERFGESTPDSVSVTARPAGGGEARTFVARRLVLAAGALGTTRIVLQSMTAVARPLPFVCNAHLYIPCLHARMLGQPHAERCHSLAQLTMIHDPTGDGEHLVQAQMYSYRSLLLFRLIKEAPLPAREAAWIMQALAPAFAIWAIEEEDEPSPAKFCRLRARSDGSSTLEVVAPVSAVEAARRHRHESALMGGMWALGCWPIRRVHSGAGTSLHYGGQLAFSERDEPFTTDRVGRLRGTRGVFIADGAAFRYLPAKGLTLTLMANADRVATGVATG